MDDYRELAGDRVLVLARCSGRGKTGGLEIRQLQAKAAALFQIRDGEVTGLIH